MVTIIILLLLHPLGAWGWYTLGKARGQKLVTQRAQVAMDNAYLNYALHIIEVRKENGFGDLE